MSLKLQIISLLESGFDNAQIQEKTGAKMNYICIVKKMLRDSGVKVDRYYKKTPNVGTKSYAIYQAFLNNPNARAFDVSTSLGATLSLCQRVRNRYFGVAADTKPLIPADGTKSALVYRFILSNPKASYDDVVKTLKHEGVTKNVVMCVRRRYFGKNRNPDVTIKPRPQILPQHKAMFDVDLLELKL